MKNQTFEQLCDSQLINLLMQVKCQPSGDDADYQDTVMEIPFKFIKISKLFESMVGEHTEADLFRETIPLNVSYVAMKSILEYCAIFDFNPVHLSPSYVPYKIKL